MKNVIFKNILSILVVSASILIFSGQASADSATLTLIRISTLTNVDDTEGRWQYDGGEVYYLGNLIGWYARTKRVSFGVALNTATVTLTIFLSGESPPQNVTLQGSHDFTSGGEKGSVSAASSSFSGLIGATFSGPHTSITITW